MLGSPHKKPETVSVSAPLPNYTPFDFSSVEVVNTFSYENPIIKKYGIASAASWLRKVESGVGEVPYWVPDGHVFVDTPEPWVLVYRTPSGQPDADFKPYGKLCEPPCYCRIHTPDVWWSSEPCIPCYNYASELKASKLCPRRPAGLNMWDFITHIIECRSELARRYRSRKRRLEELGVVCEPHRLFIFNHVDWMDYTYKLR